MILTPWYYTIGNCSETIYFGLLKARRENKKLILLFPFDLPWKFRFPITNKSLLSVESPYRTLSNKHPLIILARLLLALVYGPMMLLNRILLKLRGKGLHDFFVTPHMGLDSLWNPGTKEFSWQEVDKYEWSKQINEPLRVEMPREVHHRIHVKRSYAMNEFPNTNSLLPYEFVCLHVREGGFYKDYEHIRNCNILNYVPMIEEIAQPYRWVVRLGDRSMTPLPKMKWVLDYAHSNLKSDAMDIYLIQECEFYIGTQSGPMDTALLFQKPHVITNMVSWLYQWPQRVKDLGILKHLHSKKSMKELSVSEIMSMGWGSQYFNSISTDLHCTENTPDEILSVVKEFMSYPNKSQLQTECNLKRVSEGKKVLSQKIFAKEYDDLDNRYRIASRLESAQGSLGNEYLSRHW